MGVYPFSGAAAGVLVHVSGLRIPQIIIAGTRRAISANPENRIANSWSPIPEPVTIQSGLASQSKTRLVKGL
jgi:hypothetical protein